MGKARGVARRRRKAKSFRYSTNKKLKQVRKRELRKGGSISCDVIRETWDHKKSLKDNMKNMGLSHDPNKLFKGPRFVDQFKKSDDTDSSNMVTRIHNRLKEKKEKYDKKKIQKCNSFTVEEMTNSENNETGTQINGEKSVADKLSELASQPTYKNFRFGPDNIKFCVYMIEKYGDDYEAMVRDKMNYYQESAGQIRAKIKKFLAIPSHRNVYEMAKDMYQSKNEDDE